MPWRISPRARGGEGRVVTSPGGSVSVTGGSVTVIDPGVAEVSGMVCSGVAVAVTVMVSAKPKVFW